MKLGCARETLGGCLRTWTVRRLVAHMKRWLRVWNFKSLLAHINCKEAGCAHEAFVAHMELGCARETLRSCLRTWTVRRLVVHMKRWLRTWNFGCAHETWLREWKVKRLLAHMNCKEAGAHMRGFVKKQICCFWRESNQVVQLAR